MHYGFLQGEITAAGCVQSSTGAAGASLFGNQFNVESASLVSPGIVAVRIKHGCAPAKSVLVGTPLDAPDYVTIGPTQTDTVKTFATLSVPLGGLAPCTFYFVILRTS